MTYLLLYLYGDDLTPLGSNSLIGPKFTKLHQHLCDYSTNTLYNVKCSGSLCTSNDYIRVSLILFSSLKPFYHNDHFVLIMNLS